MKAGSKGNKIGKDSPTGNLQAKNAAAASAFFGRKIKNAGTESNPAKSLPVRPFRAEHDSRMT